MMDRDAGRPVGVLRIFPRLVGDDDDLLGAFGRDLARDDRHREAAVVALAAGHRDRVVEQDLVGDVDARGGRRADRQIAGVVVGAVAEVLEHVVALGERRLADPVRALAAHVGPAERIAVHPLRHEVAADARIGAHALRHDGGRVVRAAGAEIRRARRHIGHRRRPRSGPASAAPRGSQARHCARARARARRPRSRCRSARAHPSPGTASGPARRACRSPPAGSAMP